MGQEPLAERLERTKLVTKHYHQLQGLKQVPIGIVCALFPIIDTIRFPPGPFQSLLATLLIVNVFGLPIVGVWLIGRYYDQTLGQVKHSSSIKKRLITLLTWALFIVLLFVVNWVEFTWQWSISASLLVVSLVYWIGFWVTGRVLYHYLLAGSLMAVVSLLPLTGLVTASQFYFFGSENGLGLAVFGLMMIMTGLLDHGWLTRSLQSLREEI